MLSRYRVTSLLPGVLSPSVFKCLMLVMGAGGDDLVLPSANATDLGAGADLIEEHLAVQGDLAHQQLSVQPTNS